MRRRKLNGLMKAIILVALFTVAFAILTYTNILSPELETVMPETNVVNSDTTHVLIDRQMGEINLEKFLNLAESSAQAAFNRETDVSRDGEKITFKMRRSSAFFGKGGAESFKSQEFTNCPITFNEDCSEFNAIVKNINGVEYITIPYHILSCLAD